METYTLVETFLEQLPVHSQELGALAALLQNYLNPTFSLLDLSNENSELTFGNSKNPPSSNRIHVLLTQTCQLLQFKESCIWVVSVGFLELFLSSIDYNQLSKETAQALFLALVQALNTLPANSPLALGVPVQRVLYLLWQGTPKTANVGFLNTYDVILIFHQIKKTKPTMHVLLGPLLDQVDSARRSLTLVLFSSEENYPLITQPFGLYTSDVLRVWEKFPELHDLILVYR